MCNIYKNRWLKPIIFLLFISLAACQQTPEQPTAQPPESTAVSAITSEPITIEITVVVTATPEAISEEAVPTVAPTQTASPPPTVEPTATIVPTASPVPTVAATAVPQPAWLNYLNLFREMGNLPLLTESSTLSFGSFQHSTYMVKTDSGISHNEDSSSKYYSPEGAQSGKNGNIFSTFIVNSTPDWAFNFWISGPFHLTPIIDPELQSVGFGSFNEAIGQVNMSAVLDVRSASTASVSDDIYPIYFPKDQGETWIIRYTLFEWPNPHTSCPGYNRPSGPALVLQLGSGNVTPHVSHHFFRQGNTMLESCIFDETSYSNPDPTAQRLGRIILGERDAIVVMPAKPLEHGKNYSVEIITNGETYKWSFDVVRAPVYGE